MGLTLESARELYSATHQDNDGRYYAKSSGGRAKYGYHTNLGGLYVCFTCGHLCECGEEGE